MSHFVFHLPPHILKSAPRARQGFYGQLHTALSRSGGVVEFRERVYLRAHADFEPDRFHFVHQGLVELPNALNVGPSYLREFWYADPKGVFGESSLADKVFDPAAVPMDRALDFFGWLRRRNVDQRLSKHAQPQESTVFGRGHIAIFLQGHSLPLMRAAYMREVDMVAAVIEAAPDRDILIKRHPRNDAAESWPQIEEIAARQPRVSLVDANIHDILEGAALACSISSSVSVEAMLHRVPSVVFGRTDYHHCVETVESIDLTAQGIAEAVSREWPFEAFLFWFFRQNGLDLRSKVWLNTLNARLGGFALDRLA